MESNKIHIDYYNKKISESKSESEIKKYEESIEELHKKAILEERLRKGRETYYQEMLDNWMLMLVVDSIDECEMLWWDASSLEFYINIEDLKNLNFTNTHCIINH